MALTLFPVTAMDNLTMAESFSIARFKVEIENLNLEDSKTLLVQLFTYNIVQSRAYREFIESGGLQGIRTPSVL